MKKALRIMACVCFAVVLSAGFTACDKTAKNTYSGSLAGFVAIDINPSIQITTNDSGIVTSVRAANKDGAVLLSDLTLVGMHIDEAAKLITKESEQLGYLNNNNKVVKIEVAAENQEAETALKDEASSGAAEGSDKAEINANAEAWGVKVNELKASDPELYKNLNAAKLRLIMAIAEFDREFTAAKGANMSVSDLKDILEDFHDEYEDMVTDELESKFELLYLERTEEINKQIDAFYGEEYVALGASIRAKIIELEKLEALEDTLEDDESAEDALEEEIEALEEEIEAIEEQMEEIEDSVTLSKEDELKIKELKAQKKTIKEQIKTELKAESDKIKQELKSKKQELKNNNKK